MLALGSRWDWKVLVLICVLVWNAFVVVLQCHLHLGTRMMAPATSGGVQLDTHPLLLDEPEFQLHLPPGPGSEQPNLPTACLIRMKAMSVCQAERLAALAYNNTACAVHVLLDAAVQRKQNQTRLSQLSPAVKAVLQPAGVRIVFYDSARAEYDSEGRWDVRRAWQGMTGASSQALARFAARGDYNHSWLIEDDVFLTGHWGSVIHRMNHEAGDADLVAKTQRFSEDEIGTHHDWNLREQCGVRGGAGRNGSRWRCSCGAGGGNGGGCADAEHTVQCDTWNDSQYAFIGQWSAGSAEACEARCRQMQSDGWEDCFAFRFSADALEHVTAQQRGLRQKQQEGGGLGVLSLPTKPNASTAAGNMPLEDFSSYTHNLCVAYMHAHWRPLRARPYPALKLREPLNCSSAAPDMAAPASNSIAARIAAKEAQLDAANEGQLSQCSKLRASLFAEVQVLRAEAFMQGVSVADHNAAGPDRLPAAHGHSLRTDSLGLALPVDRDAPRSCRVSTAQDSWRTCTSIEPRPAWISEQCSWSMMRVSRRLAAKMTELLASKEVLAHHELYPGMACERLGDCARVNLSKMVSETGENVIDSTFSAGGWGAFSKNHSETAYRLDQGWQGPHVVVPGRIYHPVKCAADATLGHQAQQYAESHTQQMLGREAPVHAMVAHNLPFIGSSGLLYREMFFYSFFISALLFVFGAGLLWLYAELIAPRVSKFLQRKFPSPKFRRL